MAPRQRFTDQPSYDEVPSPSADEQDKIPSPSVGPRPDPPTLLRSGSTISSSSNHSTGSSAAAAADSTTTATTLQQHKLLQGPPVTGQVATAADIAREQHDFFNLVALLFVIVPTLADWDFRALLTGHGPQESWSGDYFWLNWGATLVYFLVDLIWVSSIPICVKSPGTIVKHHAVVLVYLFGPALFPLYRWFMGACLSVEINTWFLIMRRVVYKRRDAVHPAVSQIVSISFYVSWIIVRIFIYPAVLVAFLTLAYEKVMETNKLWHWPMLFIPAHFLLCVMNLKWSYDLFSPIIRQCFAQKQVKVTVSNGL